MKKIIITGASGFIGENLVESLSDTHETICVGRNFGISYDDMENILDFDVLIHLAGKAHDLKNISNYEDYYDANYVLSKRMYDFFNKSNAKIFIYLSSVKAVRDKLENDILTENFLPEPRTYYGISKLLAETYIKNQYKNDKIVIILRPCMVHGKKNKGNLNLLINFIKKGIPYPLGLFQNKRSYLSIDNLIFIIKKIIQLKSPIFEIFNVADTISISTLELVEVISKEKKVKLKVLNINPSLIRFFAKIGDWLKIRYNSETLEKLTDNYMVDNSKILNFFTIDFPYSTIEGIKKTVNEN